MTDHHNPHNGNGAMRRTAERAVASVWVTFLARASAILAGPLVALFGMGLGYIYLSDQARAEKERDANATTIAVHTQLIYQTSVNLAGTTERIKALEKNDERQDAELLRLRGEGRP